MRNDRNYGRIRIGEDQWMAQRVSWFLAHGELPAGLFVCHRCDNPPCIRPDHLFPGTNDDNMADMLIKGRRNGPVGEASNLAKLKTEQVIEIKRQLKEGVPRRKLAQQYGVRKQTIARIHNGENWKHV